MAKRTLGNWLVSVSMSSICLVANAGEVHSLDQAERENSSSNNQAFSQEQRDGNRWQSPFGMDLPSGVSFGDVISLLSPGIDLQMVTEMGIKKWPYQPDTYIGIVCFRHSKKRHGELPYYLNSPDCRDHDEGSDIALAMLTFKGDKLRLHSKVLTWSGAGRPTLSVNWNHSNLDSPIVLDNGFEGKGSGYLPPDTLMHFDFARYQISDDQVAWGIRAQTVEGYSGGGAEFQSLTLFRMNVDGVLEPILSEPMEFWKDIAGDWHEDGTRDHDVTSGENILMLSRKKHHGYYDLRIKSKDTN